MACITDFITYRGSDVTPTSGLYVNDLYGVNLSKMDAVANTDYEDVREFILRKIVMAIAYVAVELKRYAMPYFKMNSVIGHYLGGKFDEDLTYHPAVAADRGVRIQIAETTLSQIVINRVTIRSNSVGAFNVVVTDGTDTTNYPVTLVAGAEEDVEINQYCDTKNVYVTVNNIAGAEGKACMGCAPDYDILSVNGWDGTNTSSSHYGVKADVTIICNPGNMFCIVKDFLAYSVLYRFGIELANEALETDRFNYFSMVNRDDIKDLRESYMEDYNKEMETVARTLPVLLRKLDNPCIECNQNKHVQQTP